MKLVEFLFDETTRVSEFEMVSGIKGVRFQTDDEAAWIMYHDDAGIILAAESVIVALSKDPLGMAIAAMPSDDTHGGLLEDFIMLGKGNDIGIRTIVYGDKKTKEPTLGVLVAGTSGVDILDETLMEQAKILVAGVCEPTTEFYKDCKDFADYAMTQIKELGKSGSAHEAQS